MWTGFTILICKNMCLCLWNYMIRTGLDIFVVKLLTAPSIISRKTLALSSWWKSTRLCTEVTRVWIRVVQEEFLTLVFSLSDHDHHYTSLPLSTACQHCLVHWGVHMTDSLTGHLSFFPIHKGSVQAPSNFPTYTPTLLTSDLSLQSSRLFCEFVLDWHCY